MVNFLRTVVEFKSLALLVKFPIYNIWDEARGMIIKVA